MKSFAELRNSLCEIFCSLLVGTAFLGAFTAIYYFLYKFSRTIDAYLHNAPTNCTILDPATYGSSMLGIYVDYTIPENINYTMQYLQNIDDKKSYIIGHIIPCFYALNDHTYIMAENDFDIQPTTTSLILVCISAILPTLVLICLLVASVILIGQWLKMRLENAVRTIHELVTEDISLVKGKHVSPTENDIPISKNSTWTSLSRYSLMLMASCKMGIGATTLWVKAKFTQKKSDEPQYENVCDVEEKGNHKTRTSSDYSFESIEMLPPYSKSSSSGDHWIQLHGFQVSVSLQ